MAIEITAAQARQITGRCGYHGRDIEIASGSEDALEDILDGWECPGVSGDPDMKRLREEHDRLREEYLPGQWDQRPAVVRDRLVQIITQEMPAVRQRCQDSWVLTVPDPREAPKAMETVRVRITVEPRVYEVWSEIEELEIPAGLTGRERANAVIEAAADTAHEQCPWGAEEVTDDDSSARERS